MCMLIYVISNDACNYSLIIGQKLKFLTKTAIINSFMTVLLYYMCETLDSKQVTCLLIADNYQEAEFL